MNITSRFTLLAGAAGLLMAGCSAPADDDGGNSGPPPPPSSAPPFAAAGGQGGAGQGLPAAQGGASSTPAGAGTGGAATAPVGAGGSAIAAGGAAGTGGAPGGNVIPIGTGLVITPDATGWVAGSTNQFGIQGSFYSFSDMTAGGATTMTAPTYTGGRVCVSGVAGQVQMENYTVYWGGGIGLNLAQPIVPGAMASDAQPWQRGSVTGFSFNVTGSDIPTGLAFRFKTVFYEGVAVNDTHCFGMTPGAGGLVSVRFDQVVAACYTPPGGVAVPPTAPLREIQWQVATNTLADEPFNFCIENLTPVTAP